MSGGNYYFAFGMAGIIGSYCIGFIGAFQTAYRQRLFIGLGLVGIAVVGAFASFAVVVLGN